MASERTEVRLEFRGTPIEALKWLLLSIVGAFFFVPVAWVNAAIARWICRSTEFSDGTTAVFRGTGGEVVVWHIFILLVTVGQQVLLASQADIFSIIPIMVVSYIAILAIVLTIIKWFIYNLQLNPGPHLTFTGSFPALLGWYALIAISGLTIIGWAWPAVAMYRWMASQVKGEGIAVEFRATGLEMLWRVAVVALGSMLIVTIPWLIIWFTRWLVQNVVLIRGVETAWGGFIEEQRTPPKPSWPAVPPLHRH